MFVNWGDPADTTGESRPRASGEREGPQLFAIVNGACKAGDIAHLQAKIGDRCQVLPMPERALLALQGPKAVDALQRMVPGVDVRAVMSELRDRMAEECDYAREGRAQARWADAARVDMANATLRPDGKGGFGLTQERLREIVEQLRQLRAADGASMEGYDVVVEGDSYGEFDAAKGAPSQWAEAGATWWIESWWDVPPGPEGVAEITHRVAAGPPRN